MLRTGPIILIEDDEDDVEILKDVLQTLKIKNELIRFANGKLAFDYLKATMAKPLLILADINMPVMGGIELRQRVNKDDEVKQKSIPFIFLTTSGDKGAIKQAYEMSVQGFFVKPTAFGDYQKLIRQLYDYWQNCRHPND